jgi:hypothetical protein
MVCHPQERPSAGLKEGGAIRGSDGVYVFDELETETIQKRDYGDVRKVWE